MSFCHWSSQLFDLRAPHSQTSTNGHLSTTSLRSWRYWVGARLKFWRRSRVPKKGSRDEAGESISRGLAARDGSAVKSHSTILQRLRRQISLDYHTIGSLSRDVFERRTSTGGELFSLLVCLDANKFVLLSFFSPLKTIYSRVSTKPLLNDAKSSLPVDVRRSKTLLLKLPNTASYAG